jgi:hypothetical protein
MLATRPLTYADIAEVAAQPAAALIEACHVYIRHPWRDHSTPRPTLHWPLQDAGPPGQIFLARDWRPPRDCQCEPPKAPSGADSCDVGRSPPARGRPMAAYPEFRLSLESFSLARLPCFLHAQADGSWRPSLKGCGLPTAADRYFGAVLTMKKSSSVCALIIRKLVLSFTRQGRKMGSMYTVQGAEDKLVQF